MADIATIFGWPPATIDTFGLQELMQWHERAVKRSGAGK